MKTTIISIVAMLLFLPNLCSSEDAQDLNGWNKAKWGMTEEELKVAFKEENLTGLILNDFKIAENKFTVSFVMDTKTAKLEKVFLFTTEKVLNDDNFNNLQNLLTQKYGKPTESKKSLFTLNSVWNLKYTIITLVSLKMGDENEEKKFLSITYTKIKDEGL